MVRGIPSHTPAHDQMPHQQIEFVPLIQLEEEEKKNLEKAGLHELFLMPSQQLKLVQILTAVTETAVTGRRQTRFCYHLELHKHGIGTRHTIPNTRGNRNRNRNPRLSSKTQSHEPGHLSPHTLPFAIFMHGHTK